MTAHLTVDDLVDPDLGLVTALHPVERLDGLPSSYVGITAEVADARVHGNWPSDRVSLGTTFGDHAGARIAAIGEPGMLEEALPKQPGMGGLAAASEAFGLGLDWEQAIVEVPEGPPPPALEAAEPVAV